MRCSQVERQEGSADYCQINNAKAERSENAIAEWAQQSWERFDPARDISRYTVDRPRLSCSAAAVGDSPASTSFRAARTFSKFDGLPAGALTLGAGGGDSVFGPLGDEATLEMGDGAEHVKDEFAGGRRCVDFLFQAQQSDPAFFEGSDRGEQFRQRAPEPVEADHGERVAFLA